jgi:hypothetical protein
MLAISVKSASPIVERWRQPRVGRLRATFVVSLVCALFPTAGCSSSRTALPPPSSEQSAASKASLKISPSLLPSAGGKIAMQAENTSQALLILGRAGVIEQQTSSGWTKAATFAAIIDRPEVDPAGQVALGADAKPFGTSLTGIEVLPSSTASNTFFLTLTGLVAGSYRIVIAGGNGGPGPVPVVGQFEIAA